MTGTNAESQLSVANPTVEALQESEKRYRRLFESAKDGILILNADTGQVVDVNPFLLQLLGYSYDAICGQHIWELGVFKDIAASKDAFKTLQDNEYIRYEDLPLETLDGRPIAVEFVSNVYLVDHTKVIQCNIRDITKRKQAEEALLESENKFKSFAEQALAGMYIIQDDVFKYVNPKFAQMFGYTVEECLSDMPFKNLVYAEDLAKVEEQVGRRISGEAESVHYTFRGLKRNGQIFHVEVYGATGVYKGKPAATGTVLDITERNSAQEALEESEELYRTLVSLSPNAISVVDLNGLLTFTSPKARQMFGYSPDDEILGRSILSWIAPEEHEKVSTNIRRLLTEGTPTATEHTLIKKDGTCFIGEINAAVIHSPDGNPMSMIVITRDVTERAKQTREIEHLNRLYSVLSRVSQAVVWATSPEEFLAQACRDVVEGGGFLLAWIGQVDLMTNAVVPTAFWGGIGEYVRGITVYADNRPEGHGPTGICIREDRPSVHNDFLHSPLTLPWHDRAASFGIASCAAFPIRRAGRPWGALSIYSDEVDRFTGEDVRLLEKVAGDIEFALDNLDGEFQRKQAEEALRESEELYRTLVSLSPDAIAVVDVNSLLTFGSPKALQMFGYSPDDEILGRSILSWIAPEEHEKVSTNIRRLLTEGTLTGTEYTLVKKDGTCFIGEVNAAVIHSPDGNPMRMIVIIRDITDRKRAEDELRVALRFLEIMHEHTEIAPLLQEYVSEIKNYTGCDAVGIRVLDENLNIPYQAYQGFSRKFYETESPLSLKTDECMCIKVMKGDVDPSLPFFTEGGAFCVNATSRFLATVSEEEKGRTRNRCNQEGYETVGLFPFRGGGKILGLVHVADHRENMLPPNVVKMLEKAALQLGTAFQRAQAENELRKSEERLALAADATHIGMFDWDLSKNEIVWTKQYEAIFGYPSTGSSMRTYRDWWDRVHPDDLPWVEERIHQAMAERTTYQAEYRIVLPDGTLRWVEGRGFWHYDAGGRPVRMLGTVQDTTERNQVVKALRESEERFSSFFRSSPVGISISRLSDGEFVDANDAFLGLFGYTHEEVVGQNASKLETYANPEDRAKMVEILQRQGSVQDFETKCRRKSGEIKDVLVSAEVVEAAGQQYLLGLTHDITERKRGEKERKKLEEQLFQAQKMESVGRLAGGVAHDFNNMLSVIIGRAEMALEQDVPTDKLQHNIREILKAGQHSADLTRQLLAFARKQTAIPKIMDLNETISAMLKMLRRLIGEDIDLHWVPGLDLWKVKIDPSQVDQILANLAVNARDAISGVGAVTMRTENVVIDDSKRAETPEFIPGDYVLLTVSDTGMGMSRDVCEKIFEPFFTTKEMGKGTGLGLSTVYGIVKQNDGFIYVASEPGKGTTFKIYLPRFEAETAQVPSEEAAGKRPIGTETILLVEDDESVLDLGKMILENLGYTVLAARTPGLALRLAGEHPGDIRLLITDLVMPEMNGREMAEHLRVVRPNLKCLYMSGYTADVIAHRGLLDEGVNFIRKPFGSDDLAARVRQVLDHLE
jgi:PAS domain S-box-containing protein